MGLFSIQSDEKKERNWDGWNHKATRSMERSQLLKAYGVDKLGSGHEKLLDSI